MTMVLQCIFLFYFIFYCSSGLPTMSVDKWSESSFSIQAAIDSVPSNNTSWMTISVKAGVYNEQVKIPRDKPFIYLKGEGIGKTNVLWSANDTMLTSATFASMADNIIVTGITFVNSYNYPQGTNRNPVKPAVAAMISGDKTAFYESSFLGYQDTLLDDAGRHYFMNCTIEGAIDFIFGNGQSIYECWKSDGRWYFIPAAEESNCRIFGLNHSLIPEFVHPVRIPITGESESQFTIQMF